MADDFKAFWDFIKVDPIRSLLAIIVLGYMGLNSLSPSIRADPFSGEDGRRLKNLITQLQNRDDKQDQHMLYSDRRFTEHLEKCQSRANEIRLLGQKMDIMYERLERQIEDIKK